MSDEKLYYDLLEVLKSAKIHDLVFDEEKVETHQEILDERIGYILKSIKGFSVPSSISVAYVYGKNIKEEYWYVVAMNRNTYIMKPEDIQETSCNSDSEVKKVVISEVLRLILAKLKEDADVTDTKLKEKRQTQ